MLIKIDRFRMTIIPHFANQLISSLLVNDISGAWFVEFDENDIKDLFLEFRDRFLARKIITRVRNVSELKRSASHSDAINAAMTNGGDVDYDPHYYPINGESPNGVGNGDYGEASVPRTSPIDSEYSGTGGLQIKTDDLQEDSDSPNSPALPVGENESLKSLKASDLEAEDEDYCINSPVFLYPCPYSFEDLLERKPKTGSATPATHYFLAVLRQAATETGLWGPAPAMKDIPQAKRDAFLGAMSKRLNGIEKYQGEIFKRLAMALQNRRKYKRERRRSKPKKSQPPADHSSSNGTTESLTNDYQRFMKNSEPQSGVDLLRIRNIMRNRQD